MLRARSLAIGVLGACAALSVAASAAANTYTVTKKSDPKPGACKKADCSLREAVRAANKHKGADKVVLPSRNGAYRLSIPTTGEDASRNGDLDVTDKISIIHKGKGRAFIGGDYTDRLIDAFAKTTLSKLELTGGSAPDAEARAARRGIPNTGGSAIRSSRSLTVRDCLIKRNGSEPENGGAISASGPASVKVIDSILTHNAGRFGGGIWSDDQTKLTVSRSLISHNQTGSAGGGVEALGPFRMTGSTVSANKVLYSGGGLDLSGGGKIEGSTISDNVATEDWGAGIDLSAGNLVVTNSTLNGNRTAGRGAAIYTFAGSVLLNGVTVAGNVGDTGFLGTNAYTGGLYNQGASPFWVENSVIATNTRGSGNENDCAGPSPITSLGNNFVGSVGHCDSFNKPTDQVGLDPQLGGLKANGGPTKTMAVQQGSPLISSASKASAPKRDQRGRKRDKHPDIGAFER